MPLAAVLQQAMTRWFVFPPSFVLDNNQLIMLRVIRKAHHGGYHVTVDTLLSTVFTYRFGRGFNFPFIEASDIGTITNDWLALQAQNNATGFSLFPPAVVIIEDIDVP